MAENETPSGRTPQFMQGAGAHARHVRQQQAVPAQAASAQAPRQVTTAQPQQRQVHGSGTPKAAVKQQPVQGARSRAVAPKPVPYGGYGQDAVLVRGEQLHHMSRAKRRKSLAGPLIFLFAFLLLAGGAWFAYENFLKPIDVEVNGELITVDRGKTIEWLVDEGYASPKAGNLLAVDGSVLTEGGGTRFTATVNGAAAEATQGFSTSDKVVISDGEDVTEEFTTAEETVPAGRSGDEATPDSYYWGSIHLLSDGQDGTRQTKTGSVSGITVTEDVKPAVDAGYHIYTARPEDKVIALTFDDGPWPESTSAILDILEEYGAKATFFTIGNQVADHAAEVQRARDLGCLVLTHTWDHAAGSGGGTNIVAMSDEEQTEELAKGYQSIADVLGEEPPHIFRAPGGNFYKGAVDNLWPMVDAEIGWNIDTMDWSRPGAAAIRDSILMVDPGDVVLMHDGGGDRSQTVEALRAAMPVLVERGYSFVTAEELIAYGMPSSEA